MRGVSMSYLTSLIKPKPIISSLRLVYGNERGMVLSVALMLLLTLAVIGSVSLVMTRVDLKISGNYKTGTVAFSLAESGITIAKAVLRNSSNWSTELAAAQPFACPNLVPPSDGGCTYLIENDAADSGGPTTDTNNTVVVTATGQYGGSTKEVETAFNRSGLPMPSAGLTSTGIGGIIPFSGSSNEINGNNWVPPSDDRLTPAFEDNNACGAGSGPKFGISTRDATAQQALKDNIDSAYWDSITGEEPDPPWSPPSSTPSIGADSTIMSQAQLEDLADDLIAQADVTYTPGTTVTDETIGTQAAPKIVVADCTGYDPASTCLKLNGTTNGAGILVVKNGKFHMRATTEWIGIVIVVGENVQFDTGGGGGPGNILYGGVLIGENTAVQPLWFHPRNTKLRYSCDAINMANGLTGGGLQAVYWKENM